jgi:hypothetical protein
MDDVTRTLDDLPYVFKRISDYFFEKPTERFANKYLFAKLDYLQMKEVDMLEQHVAFGDYQYIDHTEDPSIVGCYFKSILKYMEEPLC